MNFETNRNLISSVEHGFTDSIISKYSYTNDLLGRRIGKVQHFDNKVKNFDFGYNSRSEVTSATEQNNANFNYGFIYDNIGNRINSTESGISKSYETNSLNQYTANSVDTGFTPTYDADGNQTRIKTSAGIFTVEYNAENRPIQFKGSMGRIYNMSYDYMGRRFFMSSYFQGMHDGGSTELFYYNGYTLIESQQILLGPNAMRFAKSYICDPTSGQATRPLAMFNSNSKTLSDARLSDANFRDARFDVMFDNTQNIHYYTHDANKNVTELISDSGDISAHYEYSPFGATIASSGDLSYSNPFQFSSEFSDRPLGLIYYNYRHYNPLDGRWINRDPIEEKGGWNLYGIIENDIINKNDFRGLFLKDAISVLYDTILVITTEIIETSEDITTTMIADYQYKNVVEFPISLLIGENWGRFWWNGEFYDFGSAPTSANFGIPIILSEGMKRIVIQQRIKKMCPSENGMHSWHAETNTFIVRKTGIITIPLSIIAGIIHETPLDKESYNDEYENQGGFNHLMDSIGDIIANVLGTGMGVLPIPQEWAGYIGNYIPGPGELDPDWKDENCNKSNQ